MATMQTQVAIFGMALLHSLWPVLPPKARI